MWNSWRFMWILHECALWFLKHLTCLLGELIHHGAVNLPEGTSCPAKHYYPDSQPGIKIRRVCFHTYLRISHYWSSLIRPYKRPSTSFHRVTRLSCWKSRVHQHLSPWTVSSPLSLKFFTDALSQWLWWALGAWYILCPIKGMLCDNPSLLLVTTMLSYCQWAYSIYSAIFHFQTPVLIACTCIHKPCWILDQTEAKIQQFTPSVP